MSNITDHTQNQTAGAQGGVASPSGKGKERAAPVDESMEEEEEEEEDDDDEEEEEDNEMEEDDEEEEEIDPSVIISGRRTRGVRVDYTSKEALAKAGLTGNEADEDEDEEMN
ncbi:hypothetical protein FA13DRAFT_1809774 [Coprinellus micaceus]|uniref:Histone chaperone domain-containing protein n=2 Tax=Coprinellus micaceus TaxID=71717 RepID=A0A4Y7TSM7_COPMI|nr:hypothetical protein FA13DRAFT_1824562 [Coprinellus micaceus]TEB37197.1 hypothetical protein FA13DRAFT_1809774 [Coprinellus micaceus]